VAPDLEGAARLRLRAEDADDLAIISACLQDALVPVRDLAYMPEDHAFFLVANRFRWEGTQDASGAVVCERVLSGLAVGDVDAVSYRGFRRGDGDSILALLAVRASPGTIHLDFARGAEIRLEVPHIRCHLSDLGEPWPTSWQPDHPAGEPA
jgi:hypothetical protein